jgi:hypothetical protein
VNALSADVPPLDETDEIQHNKIRNKNFIKVPMANDMESMEIDESEEAEEEVSDEDVRGVSVRNVFGAVIDFIANKNTDNDPSPDSDSGSNRPSDGLEVNELRKHATVNPQSSPIRHRSLTENVDEEKENSATKTGTTGSDFRSRVMSFFSYGNDSMPKQLIIEAETPQANEDEPEPSWKSRRNKNERLFDIDSETRLECIKMLQYYKPSSSSKTTSKLDKYLPTFIEMDSPIPEELSVDYEIAKYDISGLVPLPQNITTEYSDALIKYETLK